MAEDKIIPVAELEYKGNTVVVYNIPESQVSDKETLRGVLEYSVKAGKSEVEFNKALGAMQQSKYAKSRSDDFTYDRSSEDLAQKGIVSEEGELYVPESTWTGAAGGFTRGAGPTAAGALTGAAAGSVIPGVGTIAGAGLGALSVEITKLLTPAITDLVEKAGGGKQLDANEVSEKIFDALNVAKPDTAAERVSQTAGEGLAGAAGALGLGSTLKGLSPQLQNDIAQSLGKVFTDRAAAQVLGGTASAAGAQTGTEIAESKDMGPVASTLLTLGGGILGDISGTQLAKLSEYTGTIMRAKNMSLPEAAKEAIDTYQTRGPVFLSDIEPSTQTGKDMQEWRKSTSRGTRDLTYERQKLRKRAVNDLLDDYGISSETFEKDDFAKELSEDFLNTRKKELTNLTGIRDEIIDNLSDENMPKVETPKTLKLIEDMRARLIDSGDADTQPMINKLTNWESMLQNKDFGQMIEHKRTIGNLYADPSFTHLKTTAQKGTNKIRDTLSSELDEYVEKNMTKQEYTKWKNTNAKLHNMTEDFTVDTLKNVLDKGATNPDTVMDLLFSSKKSQVEHLYKGLSKQGKARARIAILAKTAEEATDLGKLSPNEFARRLRKSGAQRGIFFNGRDVGQVNGLMKWLEFTSGDEIAKTAQNSFPGEKLPGGRYAAARLIMGNPLIGIPVAVGAKMTSGELIKFMEQGKVRDLLIKFDIASNTKNVRMRDEMAKRLNEIARSQISASKSKENK